MTTLAPGTGGFVLRGRIITDRHILEDAVLVVSGERIIYSGPARDYLTAGLGSMDDLPPRPEMTILPGLIDLHCHGALGEDFSDCSENGARKAATFLHSQGTTSLLGSLVTASPKALLQQVGILRKLSHERLLEGIHLEGPFLADSQCGAQNPAWLLDPNLSLATELMEAAQGSLKTMTFAPERQGAEDLVDLLTHHQAIPSVGHTAADFAKTESILQRARAGLFGTGNVPPLRPTVTHLFNAMPAVHHRSPGPAAACLRAAKAGQAVIELVADGTHLDPDIVTTVFDLVGCENIALVTDSMAAAGLADGTYSLGGAPVTVTNNVARLDRTGAIAGGTATMLDVLRSTVNGGVAIQDAVASATSVPAAVLGLTSDIGSLKSGCYADAVIVDADLKLSGVLRRGAWVRAFAEDVDTTSHAAVGFLGVNAQLRQ